jgi:hypothetical protein
MTYACAALVVVESAVVAAARARAPRKRPSPTPSPHATRNNYLAEPSAEARSAQAEPHRNAPGAGARPGNRNAWRHGLYGRARRARRAALRAWLAAQARMLDAARLVRDFPTQQASHDGFKACADAADALGAHFLALGRHPDIDSRGRLVHRMRTLYET